MSGDAPREYRKVVDAAIEAIRNIALQDLDFPWFRSTFMSDNDMRNTLASGHAVPQSTDQLDQYLYSYGRMIGSQWECIATLVDGLSPPDLYIDYGCGQGLAGLLLNDITGGSLFAATRDVVLIEPSALALARAAAIYGRIVPIATVTSIPKRFDDVLQTDVPPVSAEHSLHVFSNSLDVLGFEPLALLAKTLKTGHHTLLSVSHDRGFNGGTPRIEGIKAAFENPTMASDLTIERSTLLPFKCDNPRRSDGVAWICEFEVHDD